MYIILCCCHHQIWHIDHLESGSHLLLDFLEGVPKGFAVHHVFGTKVSEIDSLEQEIREPLKNITD